MSFRQGIALACALALPCTSVRAEEPAQIECSPGWPNRCNVEIRHGEKAAFDGVLMSPDLAIFLGQSAEGCQERIDAAVTATAAVGRADRKRDRQIADADLRVAETERDAWKGAADRPWFEHPIVVAGTTVVVLSILFIAISGTVKVSREIQE
jgi:hypothetical protein